MLGVVIDVRTPRDDERELLHEMSQHAFSDRPHPFNEEEDRAGHPLDRRLVATVNGHVAGKLAVWEFGQWFGGRRVPVGGLASVVVKPEFRGRGIATRLLHTVLEQMRDRGEVLSSLYPMNHTLYRRAGWQSGGGYPQHEVPLRMLTDLPRPDRDMEFRPPTVDDLPVLRELSDAVRQREQGTLSYGPVFAALRFGARRSPELDAYVAEIDGRPVGSLTLSKRERKSDEIYSLDVGTLVTVDRDAELAMWRLIGAHHPNATSARFVAPLQRSLPHQFGEREIRPAGGDLVWMTRFVDVAGAIAARGYAAHVDVEVHVEIADDLAPWNAGRHVLRVLDGKGVLTPGGTGAVSMGIGELASLYTGWSDPHQLARWGLISGASSSDLDALNAAFTSPTPWMQDYF